MNFMNVLYSRFIQIVKQQQIQKYNLKHRDYLQRSQRIKENVPNNLKHNQTQNTKGNTKLQQSVKRNYIEESPRIKALPAPRNKDVIYNYGKDVIVQSASSKPAQQSQTVRNQKEQLPIRRQMAFNNTLSVTQNKQLTKKIDPQPEEDGQYDQSRNEFVDMRKPKMLNEKTELPSEQGEVVLIQCPMNCGRKFAEKALQKHAKVCQKVFQEKRKVFKVQTTNEQAEQLAKKAEGKAPKQQKKSGIPKWQKESAELRNLGKVEDDRVQCPGCGRKFNDKAASKHIPICTQKAKK